MVKLQLLQWVQRYVLKDVLRIIVMDAMLSDVKAHWHNHYSINFNNYAVQDVYAPKMKIVNGA
ncbi:MAG: hypothetical protein ACFFCI_16595 [Promethearchaeota archaeon]